MGTELSKVNVVHNVKQKRFEIRVNSYLAELSYLLQGQTIVFVRTFVPPALEGQGIGSKLAKAALTYAQENSLRVRTLCWFVDGYIKRHPEYQELIK
jgi:predicted GNAT family acetyltransferase